MPIKKLSAKHSRRADRRRSRRLSRARGRPASGISSRKPRPGRGRAARRRMDEGEVSMSRPARRERAREQARPTSDEELAAETAGVGIGGSASEDFEHKPRPHLEAAWDEELPFD